MMNFIELFENMGTIEQVLIVLAVVVLIIVLLLQSYFTKETKKRIKQLATFFPDESDLSIKKSSITKDILESKTKLDSFLKSPPERHVSEVIEIDYNTETDDYTNPLAPTKVDYSDVDLIQVNKGGSESFKEVVKETNTYLCKNVGTSADFIVIQDICERKIEDLESQISNTINVPLYLGLAGTFAGIILGLAGVAVNVESLFSSDDMSSLTTLLFGVAIAMIASLRGLGLMIMNSAFRYKKALAYCNSQKNGYYDFIRRDLMPVLSSSMASSLNSLKGVLGEFIGKFGHNLSAYNDSAELLNDNIEKQHLLLVEINKMNQAQMAIEIAESFNKLKEAADSLDIFRTYQEGLNETMENVDSAVGKIDKIIKSFEDFANSLHIVVENQGVASELQKDFRTAIEQHFPTGSDARMMWRNQFDELTKDAQSVSQELNTQLKASTEYIQSFTKDNKEVFSTLAKLNQVIDTLVQYSNVQAECYKDLKKEIAELNKNHNSTQISNKQLNADLLKAVQDMTSAIKTLKN